MLNRTRSVVMMSRKKAVQKKFEKNPFIIDTELLNKPCYELANYLLGKLLVRKWDNIITKGRIVETECYLGGEDKGSNTFGGRRTPANEPLYMPVGTAYVYSTYGMYNCFNISSIEPGAGVLIRALEPVEGIEHMKTLRAARRASTSKALDVPELCNGPSKLCISMNITKQDCNKVNMCESEMFWLEVDPEFEDNIQVVRTSRIGIQSVGAEWANKPLRFYVFQNPCISKRDKKAETDCVDASILEN